MTPICPQCKSRFVDSMYQGGNYSCPHCNCIFLPCPLCGQVVCAFGGDETPWCPCEHVVVFVTGGGDVIWERAEEEQRFAGWCGGKDEDGWIVDVLAVYATKRGWTFLNISECVGPHSISAHYVFDLSGDDQQENGI